MKDVKIIEYFSARKQIIKFNYVEKKIGLPGGTITRIVNDHYIPPKWKEKIKDYIERSELIT